MNENPLSTYTHGTLEGRCKTVTVFVLPAMEAL